MISFVVLDARAEAAKHGVTPSTRSAFTTDDDPVPWAVTWRARRAAWMIKNCLGRQLHRPGG